MRSPSQTYALVVITVSGALNSNNFKDSSKLFVYSESCAWNYQIIKKMIPRYIYEVGPCQAWIYLH